MRGIALAAVAAPCLAGAVAVDARTPIDPRAEPASVPIVSDNPSYPPLDYPALARFASAIDLSRRVRSAADGYWRPASDMLRESNPGREEAVAALIGPLREGQERLYRATALFQVDRRLPELLVPRVAAAERAASDAVMRAYRERGSGDDSERQRQAALIQRERAMARPIVVRKLDRLTMLATTAAGDAWLRRLPDGNYRCLKAFQPDTRTTIVVGSKLDPRCAGGWQSAFGDLFRTPDGRDFADLSSALYVVALAAMALSFDAGMSFDRLVPAAAIRSAGLAPPRSPTGVNELTRRMTEAEKR